MDPAMDAAKDLAGEPAEEDLRRVQQACPRGLSGWGRTTPRETLLALADEASRGGAPDRYGDGGVVAEVEEQVRALLGTEAAVLLPTGTMATQLALAHLCRTSRRVAMHASAHPLLHEHDALVTVQGLVPVVVGEHVRLADVERAHARSPLDAVLVELPQRETGGQLMPFAELVALGGWCRDSGVALHLDGARLWECGPAYAPRSLAEVCGQADSTYVSLYKALGAPGGAMLAGSSALVEQARVGRRRLGGTLPGLWPIALGARRGLRERLPHIAGWVAAAQELAVQLQREGVLLAHPPQTNLLHVLLPGSPAQVQAVLLELSRQSGVWLGRAQPGPGEGWSRVELSVQEPDVPAVEAAGLLAGAGRRLAQAAA